MHRRHSRLGWLAVLATVMVCVGLVTPQANAHRAPIGRLFPSELPRASVPVLDGLAVPPALAGADPDAPARAVPFTDVMPQVGALFSIDAHGRPTHHFCTASVVHSPHGDLIATAAHCVIQSGTGRPTQPFLFAPGYHDGKRPYGLWSPVRVLAAPGWSESGDPDDDIAFAVMHAGPSGRSLEQTVGADSIAFDTDLPALVGVLAYPSASEQPIACLNVATAFSDTQAEFDCQGFESGSSGGPLLQGVDPSTGQGTLIGVIGGYQQGGDTPDISYAANLSADAHALYEQATGG